MILLCEFSRLVYCNASMQSGQCTSVQLGEALALFLEFSISYSFYLCIHRVHNKHTQFEHLHMYSHLNWHSLTAYTSTQPIHIWSCDSGQRSPNQIELQSKIDEILC